MIKKRFYVLLPLLLLATLGPRQAGAQESGIAVGSKAPDARVFTLDGRSVRLDSFFGERPTLIEFWATWCPLCEALEPRMAELERAHGDRLQIIRVGVPDNQTAERQKAYVESRKIGGLHLFDRDGAAVRAFMVPHTSYVVLVDRTGKVVYTGQGADQDVSAAVRPVLPSR
jgi:thiol-disulfide isomerase/thioredoxin